LKNAEAANEDVIESERAELSLTPTFYGVYSIDSSNNEALDKYKFDLYEGNALLETSGWLQHNNNNTNKDTSTMTMCDEYRFKRVLSNQESYTVVYTIQTVNGYTASADSYTFTVTVSYLT
jgi:hypothetical protein